MGSACILMPDACLSIRHFFAKARGIRWDDISGCPADAGSVDRLREASAVPPQSAFMQPRVGKGWQR